MVEGVGYIPGHESDTWQEPLGNRSFIPSQQTTISTFTNEVVIHLIANPALPTAKHFECEEFVPDPRITNDTSRNLKKIWSRGATMGKK